MLRWKVRSRGEDEEYVVLEGELTEVESLVGLPLGGGGCRRVVLNLSRVRYVNSEGSRRLVEFVAELARSHEVIAELCSVAIVELLGLVPTLGSYMRVHSVIVPVECSGCDWEGDVRVVLPPGGEMPEIACPRCEECGELAEPAVLLDRYFSFIDHGPGDSA